MPTSFPRRDFLKVSSTAALGLTPLLPACTALDRLLMGQSADISDRVVILGAGMAGLRAAFELRKRGLPYRIYEGSGRVGGRAWTLAGFTRAGHGAELGAEWFSQQQPVFWDLAKELKLEIVEVRGQRDRLFLEENGGLSQLPLRDLTRLRELARQFENLPQDRMRLSKLAGGWASRHRSEKSLSALTWARHFSEDRAWVDLIESWAAFNYGVAADQVHSSAFARAFLFSDQPTDPWAGNRFRFQGGSSALATALLDRVMGAIPGDRLLISHRLVRVERLTSGFQLHFETPEGRRRYRALHVICTLPWPLLAEVEGLEELLPAATLSGPVVSHQAKAVMSFRERIWRRRWSEGRILHRQPLWESSYRSQEWIESPWGVLSTVWSGEDAVKAGPAMVAATVERLGELEKNPSPPLQDSHVQNWSSYRWAKARGAYPSLSERERDFLRPVDTWRWAGEHAAGDLAGTWAGALASGGSAAQEMIDNKVVTGVDASSSRR